MSTFFRNRYRRSPYAPITEQPRVPIGIQRILVLLILGFILWWLLKGVAGLFGFGSALDREPASLTTEPKGIINVSLQGSEPESAEDGMMLFPGDGLSTGANGHASLRFFDDTLVRLDTASSVTIDESGQGPDGSEIRLTVQGGVWAAVPHSTATGSSIRRLLFPTMTLDLPAGSEVVASTGALRVYSAEGAGVNVTLADGKTFIIGEGQQWVLPPGAAVAGDPYAFRSPIDQAALGTAMLVDSRKNLLGGRAPSGSASSASTASGELLTIREPAANATVSGDSIAVRGTVNGSVNAVRVNGHNAVLNKQNGTYSMELALPQGEKELEISVAAMDAQGKTLTNLTRIVKLTDGAPTPGANAPTIETPAKNGETYATNAVEVVLRGKAPANAAGIMVNEYRLQLFNPEKGEWSYIASIALGNLKAGSNTFDVVALNADGAKSPAVRITIIQGQGDGGVTPGASSTASAAASSVPLSNNAPLTPGILAVTGPTPGAVHNETGTGFLLEGKTSKDTDSVWVNDYRLQLYKPGVTFWNYIADVAYGNLKPGSNAYEIVARNAKGELLDRLTYTVEYRPAAPVQASSAAAQ